MHSLFVVGYALLIIMCADRSQSFKCIKHQAHHIQKHVDPKDDDDGMRFDLDLILNEINND